MFVPVQWVLRPLFVFMLIAVGLYLALRVVISDKQYAGYVASLCVVWSFFGRFQRELFERSAFWDTSPGIIIAFIAWTAVFIFLGNKKIWSWLYTQTPATYLLNLISFFLLLFPVFMTSRAVINSMKQTKIYEAHNSLHIPLPLKSPENPPDVYWIILDGYGREDFLRETYDLDTSDFIDFLKDRDFYVAEKSAANYPQTILSLPSAANMQYLDEFSKGLEDESSRAPLQRYFRENDVMRSLQNAGYKIVALRSATLSTQLHDADYYIDMAMLGNLNEFEGLALSSTLAGAGIEALELNLPIPSYRMHRDQIYFTLDNLETVVKIPGPKFVFSHILAPHPPFVLDATGNPVQAERPFSLEDTGAYKGTHEEYIQGYSNQVRYLNWRLMEAVDSILAKSDSPPIIIIQGDHGPGSYFDLSGANNTCLKERYSILNAYYFPDGRYAALYPTITPVNSFRVVFNQYFGVDLDILDDKSYFATWLAPYRYIDVSDDIRACELPSK